MTSWKSAYVRARQVAFLAKHPFLDLYLLDGVFRGLPLRMLVADDGYTLPYISSIAFPDGADVSSKGRISALKAPGLAESGADVVVVGANLLLGKLFAGRGFHMAPKWLCPVMRTHGEHPDAIISRLGKSARSDVRRNLNRANESDFSYEVTTDRSWFDTFYSHMYKPYAEHRHGNVLQLDSYGRVRRAFAKGAGIVLKQHGEVVGGSIFYMQGKTMRNPYMGILNGDESVVRAGASQILYYYVMLMAHAEGCDAMNFGSSRPFLSDGVLKFKMKWGMDVVGDDLATAVFAIATPRQTEASTSFLAANPFFEMVGGELRLYRPERESFLASSTVAGE